MSPGGNPLGQLATFYLCSFFSFLPVFQLFLIRYFSDGDKFDCEKEMENSYEMPCSEKEDAYLTAALFNLSAASGFCRRTEPVSLRTWPLEIWG